MEIQNKVQYLKVASLKTHPNNPRLIKDEAFKTLCESIKDNKDYFEVRPILCNKDLVVFAGNMRLKAALALGIEDVPCVIMDISEERQKELMIRDNVQNGIWSPEILAANFETPELEKWGVDMAEFGVFNNPDYDGTKISLQEKFIVPPFSIFDTRQGYWQDRKRKWLELIPNIEESREDTLMKGGSDSHFARFSKKIGTTSHFDPVLAEIVYRWFCPAGGKILDPFGGEQTKGVVAGELGFSYEAVEFRQEQVDVNNRDCAKYPAVKYHCGDSNNLSKIITDTGFDLVFTSPPYYDLEVYSKEDMSALGSYDEFMAQYKNIFAQCVEKMKDNSFLLVKVGEVRNKKTGVYRNFVGDNIRIFQELGLKYWNEIIIINALGSLPLRAKKGLNASRKIGKAHQNLLAFYKGEADKLFNPSQAVLAVHENLLAFFKGDPTKIHDVLGDFISDEDVKEVKEQLESEGDFIDDIGGLSPNQ